jgi:hypothetical protein
MIGSAVGVAGGREMTPQAMAQLLRLADPRPSVILAIQSLGYQSGQAPDPMDQAVITEITAKAASTRTR